jgi:hypothetical protein
MTNSTVRTWAADTLWKNYLPWTSDPYEGGSYLDYMVNTNETIGGVAYTSNVAESGGQLHLNTQSVTSTPIVDGSNTLSYTGAMLTTNSSFSTQYGYAETSLKSLLFVHFSANHRQFGFLMNASDSFTSSPCCALALN